MDMCGKGMDMCGKGMGKDGKPGGKGEAAAPKPDEWVYVPGTYYEEPGTKIGIEGLKDAITRAIEPHRTMERYWNKDTMVNKLCLAIFKVANVWRKEDNRHKETGTA